MVFNFILSLEKTRLKRHYSVKDRRIYQYNTDDKRAQISTRLIPAHTIKYKATKDIDRIVLIYTLIKL